LTNNVQNLQIKECRLNYHGYRTQAHVCAGVLNNADLKLVDTSRKTEEYSTGKIDDLVKDSKDKNIRGTCRGINEFKKGYQPRTNLINGQNGDLFRNSYRTLNGRKNHFCHLLNVLVRFFLLVLDGMTLLVRSVALELLGIRKTCLKTVEGFR
jgi:hypothetical protein